MRELYGDDKKHHDMRASDYWHNWCQEQFDLRPGITNATEGATHFSAFMAGWRYRYEAAERRGLSSADTDTTILRDSFLFFQRKFSEAVDQNLALRSNLRHWSKRTADAEQMLRKNKLDPLDAPAWKRISEQRKEIKRLIRENQRLKGELLERGSNA